MSSRQDPSPKGAKECCPGKWSCSMLQTKAKPHRGAVPVCPGGRVLPDPSAGDPLRPDTGFPEWPNAPGLPDLAGKSPSRGWQAPVGAPKRWHAWHHLRAAVLTGSRGRGGGRCRAPAGGARSLSRCSPAEKAHGRLGHLPPWLAPRRSRSLVQPVAPPPSALRGAAAAPHRPPRGCPGLPGALPAAPGRCDRAATSPAPAPGALRLPSPAVRGVRCGTASLTVSIVQLICVAFVLNVIFCSNEKFSFRLVCLELSRLLLISWISVQLFRLKYPQIL